MPGSNIQTENQQFTEKKSLRQKYNCLRKLISDAGGAVVAFSGGVDSTFLLKVCVELLGNKVLAVTARSDTFPARELNDAVKLAGQMGARHTIITSEELDVPGFSDNPPNRCFLCKHELFSKIKSIANDQDLQWVFDGSNLDDTGDFRPGRMAARRLKVRSPLEEAELTKKDIRSLSRKLKLPTWNKPSFACLSSRFPYNKEITRPALRQVEDAENILWKLGMREFRVRHHDTIARIELGEKEMQTLWGDSIREEIVNQIKSLGYHYVTLDLQGYRTGSMNETLNPEYMTTINSYNE